MDPAQRNPNELAMKWPKFLRRDKRHPRKPEPAATQPDDAYTYRGEASADPYENYTYRGGASADPTPSDFQFFKDRYEDLTLQYETLRMDIARLSAYQNHDEKDKEDIWQEIKNLQSGAGLSHRLQDKASLSHKRGKKKPCPDSCESQTSDSE